MQETKEMTIKEKFLDILYGALYEDYEKERTGTHVSDIIYCPRKTCYQKLEPRDEKGVIINPKKRINNKDLNFFTSGKAIHGALQSLVKKYPHRYEVEKEVWLDNLVAHIDIFDTQTGMPIEAKSARINTMTRDELYAVDPASKKNKLHYLDQLKAYMAMTDSDTGKILVQCLMHFEDKPFVEYDHTMTKQERENVIWKLKNDAKLLQEGIEAKNPAKVRHIAYDTNYNWLCKSCKYVTECEELRNKERAVLFKK